MKNFKLSWFEKIKIVEASSRSLNSALTGIQQGKWGKPVEDCWNILADKKSIPDDAERSEAYRRAKLNLPAFAASVLCHSRSSRLEFKFKFIKYNFYIVMDFDKFSKKIHGMTMEKARDFLENDSHVHFCFASPSNDGLKVGIFLEYTNLDELRIDPSPEGEKYLKLIHSQLAYEQVSAYFLQEYGLVSDDSCRDLFRLCFVSDDPDLYFNSSAQPFVVNVKTAQDVLAPTAPQLDTKPNDFSVMRKALLKHAQELVTDWLPGGDFKGDEWVVLNPMRNDKNPGSFKINVKSGRWSDFACDNNAQGSEQAKGGDLVSFYAYLFCDGSQKMALDKLSRKYKTLLDVGAHDFYTTCGMSAAQLFKADFPPIRYILGDWLINNSVNWVFAPTGTYKSWFVMELAMGFSTGKACFGYLEVFEKFTVAIVDGEMGWSMLQHRYRMFCSTQHKNLHFLSSDQFEKAGESLNILEKSVQDGLERYFERVGANFVIFDNLSSLVFGIDENSSQAHEPYLVWFRRLRSLGYTVVVVDHTGKDGKRGARGSSKKIDWVNANIGLTRTADGFVKVKMNKCRFPDPKPDSFRLKLNTDNPPHIWQCSESSPTERGGESENVLLTQILAIFAKDKFENQTKLAQMCGVSQSKISRMLTECVADGYLTKDHVITVKGGKFLKS